MALTYQQIQKTMDFSFKKFRDKKGTKEALLIREFLDLLADDLSRLDKREGVNKQGESKQTENQVKMVKALRMNNPLWDL